jgi:hypothetical protein
VKSTRVVALAALLACLPVRAVELIDLHDSVLLPAHPPAIVSSIFPSLDGPADEWGALAPDQGGMPAEPVPPAVAVSPATPVPEPFFVVMLAGGLLLMVPGAWAARWSRLGDNESLLPRRLP